MKTLTMIIAASVLFVAFSSLNVEAKQKKHEGNKVGNKFREQAQQIVHSFAYPIHQPVVKNPRDYGQDFENFTVKTDDGINLAGWLLKSTGNKVIIMTHVGTFSKYGLSIEAKKAGRGDALGYT